MSRRCLHHGSVGSQHGHDDTMEPVAVPRTVGASATTLEASALAAPTARATRVSLPLYWGIEDPSIHDRRGERRIPGTATANAGRLAAHAATAKHQDHIAASSR
jgi:hypothetical protein